jgi:hypothetical protein
MTSQPHLVQPPPIAVWLLNLFALGEEAESIQGDLLEEFSLLASKSGSGFRTAPWITTAAVVGGFLLRKTFRSLGRAPDFCSP